MFTIEKRQAKSWVKCSCCGEMIRTCENYFQVLKDGKQVRGERYCTDRDCENVAYENNEISETIPCESDGEERLRQAENYAAYRAAGCTDAYWTDRDAGYVE